MAARRQGKKGIDADQARSNRAELSSMLRKDKREEQLAKRRGNVGGADVQAEPAQEIMDPAVQEKVRCQYDMWCCASRERRGTSARTGGVFHAPRRHTFSCRI